MVSKAAKSKTLWYIWSTIIFQKVGIVMHLEKKGTDFDALEQILMSPSPFLVGNTVTPPASTRVRHWQGWGGEKAGDRRWKESGLERAWKESGRSLKGARRHPCQAKLGRQTPKHLSARFDVHSQVVYNTFSCVNLRCVPVYKIDQHMTIWNLDYLGFNFLR